MDIKPVEQQSISDDQELAKVLAGVSQQTDESQLGSSGLQLEETPLMSPAPVVMPDPIAEPIMAPTMPEPVIPMPPADGSLDSIKKEALNELRPLVDKLDVSPEEKFDTYLLLIRSTDDKALIPSAYASARAITDEARRAQALLDIIKEIDYLSGTAAQPIT
ncbi:MAG: hypothetical protein ABIQ04_04765 [Candidatus Saccharimonadales bacterium]